MPERELATQVFADEATRAPDRTILDGLFSENYSEARAKFLNACDSSGTSVKSYRHPDAGPDGEELFTDVACFGPRQADRVLVLCSGTHGVEGVCGSGIQTGLLRDDLRSRLKDDQRVVMIHALNPWGFAHLRRVNEDNVDLNRNFVDHSKLHPANSDYDALADAIAPRTYWSLVGGSFFRLFFHQLTRGTAALQAALTRGQYAYPKGLFYGGQDEVWSNKTFRTILNHHVSGVARMVFIDLHTGLGRYGHGEIITNSLPSSPEYARAAAVWGERVKMTKTGESVSTDLVGTIQGALSKMTPQTEVTTVTLEFGTYTAPIVFCSLQAENWLHHHGGSNPRRAAFIKAWFRRAFRFCSKFASPAN